MKKKYISFLKEQFGENFFCKGGNCGFCDGNGKINIPHAKFYEVLLMKHHIIADFDFRQLVMMVDMIRGVEAELGKVMGMKSGCIEVEPYE